MMIKHRQRLDISFADPLPHMLGLRQPEDIIVFPGFESQILDQVFLQADDPLNMRLLEPAGGKPVQDVVTHPLKSDGKPFGPVRPRGFDGFRGTGHGYNGSTAMENIGSFRHRPVRC